MNINLRQQFGETYKIEYEEGHSAKENDEAFYQLIPCKYGFIQLYDNDLLAAYCNAKKISSRWAKDIDAGLYPGFKVIVQGDYELRVSFPPDQFQKVAALLQAKKKKRISEVHKVRLLQGLKEYRAAQQAVA